MKRVLVFSLIIIGLLVPIAFAQQPTETPQSLLAERIQRIMDRPEFRHALFGIEFFSLDSGQPLYRLNADKLFTPASTTKLLTEGTALELLGGDFRFHTRVYRTGPINPDGTLDGDLVLVAGGDPNLSGRVRADGTLDFENEDHSYGGDPATRAVPGDPLLIIRKLAQQVTDAHIRKIRGHLTVDVSLFPEGQRELGTGVVISPVVVNDNLVDVTIGPGPSEGAPVVFQQSPATSYVSFINKATTGKPDSKPEPRWASDIANPDGSRTVTITGSFPAGKPAILYNYAVPAPSRFAEVVLVEALREKGIQVKLSTPGETHDFKALSARYVPDQLVAEHVSAPLKEEVKVTLKVSQNLHASMTPMILAALLGPRDDSKTGFDLEREFLQRSGLDLTGAAQGDGAGGNAHFTPEFMVSYLAFMAKQNDYSDFFNALPILGRDGTLFDIQSGSTAAGKVHAKTGTFGAYDPLNRKLLVTAKGLAGYMTTASGRHVAFAIYINNVSVRPDGAEVKRVAGQAVGEIAAAAYESVP
jgi:D-alanyl-D-alanine carboxypeptidase/D-alanyl-D-alanine-endopeptidase (penicillin-binding protein 4)